MKTLYIDRSAGSGRDGGWVERLDLEDVGRIVVGTGPGSFAGIRSAIAFAQGFALGRRCEVLGLPSPCAVAAQVFAREGAPRRLAVVGDARCGKLWIALFDGYALAGDVFQVDRDGVAAALSGEAWGDCPVVTADEQRIGGLLRDVLGDRYLCGMAPTDEGLRMFAEASPSSLRPEPLPIYLNPAVRGTSNATIKT